MNKKQMYFRGEIMKYAEYRVYCNRENREHPLCKFWLDESGNVDEDNLPSKGEIARLLQALRIYEAHVEFTGKVENE